MTTHRKTKYDTTFFERYARQSLIELVDASFVSLKNYDRPDLQDDDGNVGIEVTRAIREDRNVAHALINEMAGRPVMAEVSDEDWHALTTYGYGYGLTDTMIGRREYDYWASALPLQRIIQSKVRKVTDGFYGRFREFGLYIFSKETLTDDAVQWAVAYTMALQEGHALRYARMYICQVQQLFVCNLTDGTFDERPVSPAQCRRFYREALKTDGADE